LVERDTNDAELGQTVPRECLVARTSSIPAASPPCADLLLDRHDSGGGLFDIPDRRNDNCAACATGRLWTIAARQDQIRAAKQTGRTIHKAQPHKIKEHRTPASKKDGCRKRKQKGAFP
jgi:hypothetical protein